MIISNTHKNYFVPGVIDLGLPESIYRMKVGNHYVHMIPTAIMSVIKNKMDTYSIPELEAREGIEVFIQDSWRSLNDVIVITIINNN